MTTIEELSAKGESIQEVLRIIEETGEIHRRQIVNESGYSLRSVNRALSILKREGYITDHVRLEDVRVKFWRAKQ